MRRLLAPWIVANLLALNVEPARGTVHVVALTGSPAADEAPGVTFANFGSPTLNRFGHVAFLASVAGPGIVAGEEIGLWSGGTGGIVRSVRGGLQVPGDATSKFGGFGNPTLDASSEAALIAELRFPEGTPAPETVVVSGSPGAIAPLYRRGDLAPGLGGVTFNASGLKLAHNESGQSAFNATVLGAGVLTTNDGVIYAEERGGALRLVAREGNTAPGALAGVNFSVLLNSDFAMNNAGQVAFLSSIAGPGVTFSNDRGIWSEGPGALSLVARTGTQAPGAPVGSNFTSFLATGLQINDRGHVAFVGFNERTGPGDDQGIWSDRSGVLAPVAINNQAAAGINGGVFLTAFREATLNGVDEAAYIGFVDGPGVTPDNSLGLWSEAMGGPRLVAREGDLAPGVTDGAVVRFFEALAMNRWGQTAFYGTLGGAGISSSNDNGLWAEDPDGEVRLIVREGDGVEVVPGDTRTVQALAFVGGPAGQDGRRSAFNHQGQLAALARFTDGSAAVLLWDDTLALPGDFDADGVVDAADYTVWRNRLGTTYADSEYEVWRANFGQTAGSESILSATADWPNNANAAVPEPPSFWLLFIAAGVAAEICRRRIPFGSISSGLRMR